LALGPGESAGGAYTIRLDGRARALELEREGGAMHVTLPDDLASLVYLPASGAGVYPVAYLKRWGVPELWVTVFGAGRAFSGTCRIENLGFVEPFEGRRELAARALPFRRDAARFSMAPGGATTITFPLETLAEHWWTVRVRVTLAADGADPSSRDLLLMPLVLGGSWELLGGTPGHAVDGRQALELGPTREGYQYRLPDFWLEPRHRYRFTVSQMRDGFQADVRGVRLTVRDNDGGDAWEHFRADSSRPGEWQVLSDEFVTPAELTRAALYLYNVRSPHTARFDALQVEDLGPVR
jgi:hypothetical protein